MLQAANIARAQSTALIKKTSLGPSSVMLLSPGPRAKLPDPASTVLDVSHEYNSPHKSGPAMPAMPLIDAKAPCTWPCSDELANLENNDGSIEAYSQPAGASTETPYIGIAVGELTRVLDKGLRAKPYDSR